MLSFFPRLLCCCCLCPLQKLHYNLPTQTISQASVRVLPLCFLVLLCSVADLTFFSHSHPSHLPSFLISNPFSSLFILVSADFRTLFSLSYVLLYLSFFYASRSLFYLLPFTLSSLPYLVTSFLSFPRQFLFQQTLSYAVFLSFYIFLLVFFLSASLVFYQSSCSHLPSLFLTIPLQFLFHQTLLHTISHFLSFSGTLS